MRRSPHVLLLFTCLGLIGPPGAFAEDVPGSRFEETVRTRLVEIPVQVMQKGEPVAGLSADDFVVTVDGREEAIVGFEVADLRLDHGEREPDRLNPNVSLAARRHFLLLFDYGFSSSESVRLARSAVRRWVVDDLHPWDLVAVAVYDTKRGAKLLLNFTTDRDQVDLAIDSLGHPNLVAASGDPLGLELGFAKERFSLESDTARAGNRDGNASAGENRAGDSVLETLSLIYHSAYEPVNREGQRHLIYDWTRSLNGLADTMAAIKGRKYVVLMSEGFDGSLVFASSDRQDVDYLNQASERGELWKIDSSKRFGSAVAQRDLAEMVDRFRRADCVIQAIDIAGTRGSEAALSSRASNGLFFLANETGGEVQRGYGRLDEAMRRVAAQTSVSYLLSVQPEVPDDSKFHRIRVRLRNRPRGTSITHRPGFYPEPPYSKWTPEQRRQRAAESILAGHEPSALSTRVFASAFAREDDDRASVPVLIEIDGLSLPRADDTGRLELELFAYALRADGGIGGFFTQQLHVDMQKIGERVRAGGLKFYGNMALEPGQYSLRVLVRDRSSGQAGGRVLPVTVPHFGEDDPRLLVPQFPEPRGKWVLARQKEAAEHAFPFMFGEEPYLPAAEPVWDSLDGSPVLLVGYGLSGPDLDLEAAVVDRHGTRLAEPSIELLEIDTAGPAGRETMRAQLGGARLAPGSYRLEITLRDGESGWSTRSSAPFVLRPGRRTEHGRRSTRGFERE